MQARDNTFGMIAGRIITLALGCAMLILTLADAPAGMARLWRFSQLAITILFVLCIYLEGRGTGKATPSSGIEP
jgi:hypothetical protein